MKYYYSLLFSVVISLSALGQQTKIDSLKAILKKQTVTKKKLLILDNLTQVYSKNTLYLEGRPYFSQMASLSIDLDNPELEVRSYLYLAESYMLSLDSTQAKSFAKKAILKGKREKRISDLLKGTNQLGRVYHHFQKYEEAIETYGLGLKEFYSNPQNEPIPILSNIYSNLSVSYDKIDNVEKLSLIHI